jgi:ferredoxin
LTYVITQPCEGVKDATCVQVCPVDCIHTTPDSSQYYIDPDICIDCEQCKLVCPVDAIFLDTEVPSHWHSYINRNADFFRKRKRGGILATPLERALDMVNAAHAKARELSIEVSAAVVDEAGRLICFAKMDRALAMTVDIAINKAYTAADFQMSTANVGAMSTQPQGAAFLNSLVASTQGKIIALGGGLPILEDGVTVIGAIGVSGGTPDQDEECCRAGLAAVGY